SDSRLQHCGLAPPEVDHRQDMDDTCNRSRVIVPDCRSDSFQLGGISFVLCIRSVQGSFIMSESRERFVRNSSTKMKPIEGFLDIPACRHPVRVRPSTKQNSHSRARAA